MEKNGDEKMKKYSDINNSIEVAKLYMVISESLRGLHYKTLLDITNKKKSNLSDQLKPLKDNGLVVRQWDKVVHDYLFVVTNKKYDCPCCGRTIK